MKKIALALVLLFSTPTFADTYEHGDTIIGHISFNDKMNSAQVEEVGKQILKDDTHFTSMAVVGTGPHEWGLYFRYTKNEKITTNAGFSKFYQDKIKAISTVHGFGISCSDGVVILK